MKIFLLLATAIILVVSISNLKPLATTTKVMLLFTQEFPQVPIKPLHLFTHEPKREKISFGQGDQKIVADLFIPHVRSKIPTLIVAMGVRTSEKDKPTILGFSDTLARLGYIVLWPRLEALEKDKIKVEEPQTFIHAFNYLEQRKEVDKTRISFIGFSVGSSIAMVAAEDRAINDKVHGFVFFGGYFNILDYLSSLATKTVDFDGKKIKWKPDNSAINHAKGILKKEGLQLEQFSAKNALNKKQEKSILKFSPNQNVIRFKAPVFILHEKSDTFVPYFESIKLKHALEGKVPLIYHQANLFEHVQPQKGLSPNVAKEFIKLFLFLYNVFIYI